MIIDSSAIVAVLINEPEAERMVAAISLDPHPVMSVVNWLEVMMVIEGRNGGQDADRARIVLLEFGIRPLPFDAEQLREAVAGFRRYGKGRHPASLNLSDCCAYAASRVTGEALLFNGNDFSQTDVRKAEW